MTKVVVQNYMICTGDFRQETTTHDAFHLSSGSVTALMVGSVSTFCLPVSSMTSEGVRGRAVATAPAPTGRGDKLTLRPERVKAGGRSPHQSRTTP